MLHVEADRRTAWKFLPFVSRRSPNGVGVGGFATADFSRGECLLAELPLMQCVVPDRKRVVGGDFAALLQRQLAALTDDDRLMYFSLCQLPDGDLAGLPESIEAAFGIWMTNAYPTCNGAAEGGDGQAVFQHICRLQHSCCPNTLLAWNGERGAQTAHAAVNLAAGEELTVAYWGDEGCGVIQAERKRKIQERFGFECACAKCRLTGAAQAASDQRQRKLGVLAKLIETARDVKSSDMSEHVTAFIQLLEEEDLPAQWAERFLVKAADHARRSGDAAMAQHWAAMAACSGMCAGDGGYG